MKFSRCALALAMAVSTASLGAAGARAELVFDDEAKNAPVSSETLDEVTGAPAQEQASVETRSADRDLPRAEVLRRQRLREELKNEDLLTQKLEELRLKDEMKRTDQLLGSGVEKAAEAEAPLKEERIGAAALEQAPAVSAAMPAQAVLQAPVQVMAPASASTAVAVLEEQPIDQTRVSITPRGGTSSLVNSVYDISSEYAVGAAVTVDASEHIAFSGGYTYSSYLLGAGNTLLRQSFYNPTLRDIKLNDNVIDVGVRAHVLGLRSKVRPFIGAGAAYRKGFVRFEQPNLGMVDPSYRDLYADNITISGFAGFLETGIDFQITKAISLTGSFRYFNVFSAKQSRTIPANVFVDPFTGAAHGAMAPSPFNYGFGGVSYDPNLNVSNALAKNNFYQLQAGVSISF